MKGIAGASKLAALVASPGAGFCGVGLSPMVPVFAVPVGDFGEGCSRFLVAACKAAEKRSPDGVAAGGFAGPGAGVGLATIWGTQAITVLFSAEEIATSLLF